MDVTEFIGKLSGILVLLSAVPYAYRVYQGKIKPNISGWSLWSFIGFLILLNYKNIGAENNIWPAIFGFTNPFIITLIAIWKKGEKIKLNKTEYFCLFFGVLSSIFWFISLRVETLSQYALFIAIIADACALVPTILFVWKNPKDDRPLMWVVFAVGYGISIFAIEEHNLANYSLPIYMFLGSIIVSYPLMKHRIKSKIKIKEWI